MYFVKAIHKDNKNLRIKRISLLTNNLSSEKEAIEIKEFFEKLTYKTTYNSTFEIIDNLKDVIHERKGICYAALTTGNIQKDCPDKAFYFMYNKQKAIEKSNNAKKCYKVSRQFLLPIQILIPIKIYEETQENILEAISKTYFDGEEIFHFGFDYLSHPRYKAFIYDNNKKITGVLYTYFNDPIVIKVSDIKIAVYKENKKKTMKNIMIDTVLKNALDTVLNKHGMYSYNTGLDTNYTFPKETIDNIILNYFKEKVLPDLKEIGLQVKKKDLNKFVKNSYREKVLFTKKHLFLDE